MAEILPERIQRKVALAGKPWGWEDQVPQWWVDQQNAERCGQGDIFSEELESEVQRMCAACHKKAEA